MVLFQQKITIIRMRPPSRQNINDGLQWFGSSLGLFNLRDKDKSCFRLFIELLRAAKKNHGLTSDELAERLKLSRGTIIHHLNKLIDSGLVLTEKNKYVLRTDSLSSLVDEVEKDTRRLLEDIKNTASVLDRFMDS
ncbi:winged helix-turn-helix domain-containing protein [Candidatus Woesearchaeota archaeon]|nr:winged helix-turn-helix domain-containing protein [Candidatus Woesearchaeota archaeon]